MSQEHKKAIERWRTEDLPVITAALKELAPQFAQKPLPHFNIAAQELITTALEQFMKRRGIMAGGTFTPEDTEAFLMFSVSALNSALPTDYPYVIVIFLDERTDKRNPAVMLRKFIPGAHDITRSDIIPMIKWKGPGTPQPGDCVFLEKTGLDNPGANPDDDTLEAMWRKS